MYKILYLFIFIICCIILVAGYIKIKFQFWSIQPVFHVYDFYYYLFPVGIISSCLPEKNKYCNFKNIETINYANLSELKITLFTNFTRQHYLQNKENKYIPKKNNIMPYFEGHNSNCYFTFYTENELLADIKTNTTITADKIIGVITCRPLNIYIKYKKLFKHMNVYYIDYLCVDKMQRKKGIAPQLIQTHEYNQRHLNKKIQVSLFKREGELTGIVPICVYKTVGFKINNIRIPADFIASFSLIECGKTNLHYLIDFLKEKQPFFDIFILSEISNIMELIKTNNIWIYMIIKADEILCIYIFKKTCTTIGNNEVLSCIASINGYQDDKLFINGFKLALHAIIKKNNNFKYITIEDLSDNNDIINNLKKEILPFIVSPTAYFFYNFAISTVQSNKAFICC